jgi:hypothetical protein
VILSCVPVQRFSVLQAQYQVAVESAGCKAMVSLFNGTKSDSLASLQEVTSAKKR